MPKKFGVPHCRGVLNYRPSEVEEGRIRDLAKAKGVLLQVEEAASRAPRPAGRLPARVPPAPARGGTVTAEVVASYGERWDAPSPIARRGSHTLRCSVEATEEVEKRRGMVMEASRGPRKLLENLKKRSGRLTSPRNRAGEQKALDEFSAIAYVRKDLSPRSWVGRKKLWERVRVWISQQ
jgi:hypothetical protein